MSGRKIDGAVKVGIIGCGEIVKKRWIPCLELDKNAELVACSDIDGKNAEATAREAGVPWHFSDYRKMLRDARLDAVFIATPSPTHLPITLDVVKAGKHILLEKPMCLDLPEANQIADAVKRTDIVFFPLPYDAHLSYLKARELIVQGFIGKPVAIESSAIHPGVNHAGWFYRKGGGTLNDMGVYPISWMVGFMGPAEKVSSFQSTIRKVRKMSSGEDLKVEVEDNVALILQFADGVLGVMNTNYAAGGLINNVIFHATVYGTGGIMHLDHGEHLLVFSTREVPDSKLVEYEGQKVYSVIFPPVSQLTSGTWSGPEIVRDFLGCIMQGKKPQPPLPNLDQQRHVIEIIDKAYQSARQGVTMTLETTFKP
jgi:predicted dehydrogenase